jgi:hypothetical protein
VIAALVDASPFLTRLELGLGAEATGGLMRRVAARCPHMQDLTLRLVSVDTEGAGAGFVAGGWRLGVGTKGWGLGTGDWGLGTGDWGLGTGDWGLESGDWGLGTGDWGLRAGGVHHACGALELPNPWSSPDTAAPSTLPAGAAAVLRGCPKLRALRMQHCADALNGAALAAAAGEPPHRWALLGPAKWAVGPGALPGLGWLHCIVCAPVIPLTRQSSRGQRTQPGTCSYSTCSFQPRARWQIEDLQLVGGSPVHLSDAQLLCLLGVPLPPPPPPARLPALRLSRLLRCLALANARGLTDAALLSLAAAAGPGGGGLAIQHLRLEDCTRASEPRAAATSSAWATEAAAGGAYDGPSAGGGSSGSRGARHPQDCQWVPAFSEAVLLRLLARCPRLLSLRLRHATAPLGPGFVGAAAEACPLLQRVVLDQCDLSQRGFTLAPEAYSPLAAVQVRPDAAGGGLKREGPQAARPAGGGGTLARVACGGGVQTRRPWHCLH